MNAPPWLDKRTVDEAAEICCAVRDYNPDDVAATLRNMKPRQLADLAVVLAAMVDIDLPLSALHRWAADDFLRPDLHLCSKNEHAMTAANTHLYGNRRVCRACDRKRDHHKRSSAGRDGAA